MLAVDTASVRESVMASITVRNLSEESKARLRRLAERCGCSLEALVRSILEQAAAIDPAPATRFPHDLMAVVEPGDELEPFLQSHDQAQPPVDVP